MKKIIKLLAILGAIAGGATVTQRLLNARREQESELWANARRDVLHHH